MRATLRAGTRRSAPIVVMEDEGVNFLKQLRRFSPRFYPFSTVDSVSTHTAGGGATVLAPPALEIGSGTVGGGLRNFRAVVIENNLNDTSISDDWYLHPYHVRVKLGPSFFGAGSQANARVGVAINHPYDDLIGATRPPWPDPSETTWCSLAYHFDTDKFQLWSTPGNGVEPTEKLIMDNPFTVGSSNLVELVWDPTVPAVIAILGETERGRIATLAKLPRFDAGDVVAYNYSRMATVFVESSAENGTSVASNFAICTCWGDDLSGLPVDPWW